MNCHGLVTWAVFASGLFRPGDDVSCSVVVTETPCVLFMSNTSRAGPCMPGQFLGALLTSSIWCPVGTWVPEVSFALSCAERGQPWVSCADALTGVLVCIWLFRSRDRSW